MSKFDYQIFDEHRKPIVIGAIVKSDLGHVGTVISYKDDYDCDHDGESYYT